LAVLERECRTECEDSWIKLLPEKGIPTACRFSIDGERFYAPADNPEARYPSVTNILGKTAGAKAKQALLTWQLNNPGGAEAAAARGSAIHKAAENYIRGFEPDVPAEYASFWGGLQKYLDPYDGFVWSEKPLRREWDFCTGADGISRIWSHQHQYAGCPDVVGMRNGQYWIADFKTSVGPYSRYYPRGQDRTLFGGWKKFSKTCLQLGAYSIALEETLGIRVEMGQILVAVADGTTQSFLIRADELEESRYRWLQRVAQYKELVAAEGHRPEA
jgi:hypothetical protein